MNNEAHDRAVIDNQEATRVELAKALWEVLDALGALSNAHELEGWAISAERSVEIVELAKREI